MDSPTHIDFGLKLLSLTGGEGQLAIASLFPQIDRKPPTLHRLYAHSVFKAKTLTDLGLKFFFEGSLSQDERASFAYNRFVEDEKRFRDYLGKIPQKNLYRYTE